MRREQLEVGLVIGMLSVFLVVVLGCFIFPDIFWDGFVWKYYWGPIVADAGGDAGGLTAEYNWVDTLSYGVILALSAYFIHKLFVKKDIRVGLPFFLALSPIILIGPSTRVLEDMELFNEPLQYLFISPLIYIFLGLTTLPTLLIAHMMERKVSGTGRDRRISATLFLLIPGLTISLIISAFPSWLNANIPIWPILLISLLTAFAYPRIAENRRYEWLLLSFWAEILMVVVYLYVLWGLQGDWYDHYVALDRGLEPETNFLEGLGIMVLVIVTTAVTMVIIGFLSRRYSATRPMFNGINGMIIGGHMLDASATFVGIDFLGYDEKHVVPSGLMEILDSAGFPYPAVVMFPLKLVFLIPALYLIDVSMKEEAKESKHLIALVKLTVLILGFAPGARDIIRLSLGV